jgi:integrase
LLRDKQAYCFIPAESEKKRRAKLHARRKVPINYGNRPGTNRKRNPKRTAGERYTTNSYRRAIHRGCDKAFPAPEDLSPEQALKWKSTHRWAPNRLRHTAGTEIRKRFGLEAAQVVLGHSMADVTQIYAERDLAKAAAVIREVG